MPQISFYHLSKTNLEEALPKLLEKVLESEGRALVLCNDNERVKSIDGLLWSVGGKRFIPHGTSNDNDPELQPVFITTKEENPNNSNFLVDLKQSEDNEYYQNFQRTLLIFNGASDAELSHARKVWKKLKANSANELKYFLQDEKGSWQEKKD